MQEIRAAPIDGFSRDGVRNHGLGERLVIAPV
jgi:hypothetical protein